MNSTEMNSTVLSIVINIMISMGFSPNFHLQFDAVVILALYECGPLPPLLNGQIRIENGEATYMCDLGFSLIGKDCRICDLSNNWLGSQPVCEGMAHDYCMIVICALFNSKSGMKR